MASPYPRFALLVISRTSPRTNISTGARAIAARSGYFAGSLSPVLTGVLATATGSYIVPFLVGALVAIIAGIAYLVLLRGPIRETTAAA